MIFQIAAGVLLGLAPIFLICCGFYTVLTKDHYSTAYDEHVRAGIWFASAVGMIACILIKVLVP